MKKKKRKVRKGKLCLFILIIALIVFAIIVLLNIRPKNVLEKLGYNNTEIKEINKLSEEEINIIRKHKYNKDLIYIIKSDNYNKEKLEDYVKYTLDYSKIDYNKVLELINSSDFNNKKAKEYFDLLNKYDNVVGILKYVNSFSDKFEANEINLNFVKEKYFIGDYINRYINYYNSNSDLDYSEIITRVNSNLDYTFYDDSNPADLSKGMYTLVNKFYYLDQNYRGEDIVYISSQYTIHNSSLNKTAYENFIIMADAAKEEGLVILVTTAFRDYYFQQTLYNNYVRADGVQLADTYSARPGYSEHQLGYSVDLTNKDMGGFSEFESTKEFKWLQENAYKYGFILRYPEGKEYITGYMYEPWHYRYVGKDIAKYIYENNITYEEYYAYFLR